MNSQKSNDPSLKRVFFKDLGKMDYRPCWDVQEFLFTGTTERKLANRSLPANEQLSTEDYLLFVEHPHVYTLGKSGDISHLLLDDAGLKKVGAHFYPINRGGDITYHGPGQIVGYPIFDLDHFFTDIHRYLRYLEEAIILTLAEYGIVAGRVEGLTGVWIDGENPQKARKIAALGVKCSRWVTMHGFAFNVNADTSYFGNIIPCGISDKAVTSMNQELGKKIDLGEVKKTLLSTICSVFGIEIFDGLPATAEAQRSRLNNPL
ncbi:MAG: lipoyl(octanoyl) transferase LipB [Crocinitomicaceae bacterium]|nr:lipoyl(octanoyl) transferase LipB [Crocinitomicaceae bacterium]